jgi:hypothetical protein
MSIATEKYQDDNKDNQIKLDYEKPISNEIPIKMQSKKKILYITTLMILVSLCIIGLFFYLGWFLG